MNNRHFPYLAFLALCAAGEGSAQARQIPENRLVERVNFARFVRTLGRYASVEEERSVEIAASEANASAGAKNEPSVSDPREAEPRGPGGSAGTASTFLEFSTAKRRKPDWYASNLQIGNSFVVTGMPLSKQRANPNCREWKDEACTVCGIDSDINISVKNKTKTTMLLCRDMKPGPARVVMLAHAEPTIPGLWEVELGLGYQTSARNECPHQFIASNNPPLKAAYEVGPITIEGEIPLDGMIQILACVGLSSARVGEEGKDTGASLKVFKLRVVSD